MSLIDNLLSKVSYPICANTPLPHPYGPEPNHILQYNTENNWEGRRTEIFEIQPKDHFLEMLDTFCMEITGTKKAPFDFEQDLLNQAKIIEVIGSGHTI